MENKYDNRGVEMVCPKCGGDKIKKCHPISGVYFWLLGSFMAITNVIRWKDFPLDYMTTFVFIVAIASSFIGKSQKPPEGKWKMKCERCGENFLIDEPNKKY